GRAVRIGLAHLADRAGGSARTAAVGVGLRPVLDAVVARGCRALAGRAFAARRQHAVTIAGATVADRTGRAAGAAAVFVRLGAVRDAVAARRVHAGRRRRRAQIRARRCVEPGAVALARARDEAAPRAAAAAAVLRARHADAGASPRRTHVLARL